LALRLIDLTTNPLGYVRRLDTRKCLAHTCDINIELRAFKTRPRLVLAATCALLLCYGGTLQGMLHQWLTDEDMAHGVFVPFVIAWIVYRERSRLTASPVKPSRWAIVFLAAGACLQLASALGAGLFAGSVALLLSIAGVILGLVGSGWLRRFAFPFALALFMLPKLAFVYNQVTLPLQLSSTRMAAGILSAAGFAVIRTGNILDVSGHRIAVVEACSGIRYLLPLGFITLVFGYLSESKVWMRAALVAASVPLAIMFNALRLAVLAASPTLMTGVLHDLTGVAIFILCLASVACTQRLFVALSRDRHA
jgi:exosortase